MKMITAYTIRGAKFNNGRLYDKRSTAEQNNNGGEVLEVQAPWLETGDVVELELHRGGEDDMDGIHRGGDWIGPIRGVIQVSENYPDAAVCQVVDEHTGQHIQSIGRLTNDAFPYRNIRIIS